MRTEPARDGEDNGLLVLHRVRVPASPDAQLARGEVHVLTLEPEDLSLAEGREDRDGDDLAPRRGELVEDLRDLVLAEVLGDALRHLASGDERDRVRARPETDARKRSEREEERSGGAAKFISFDCGFHDPDRSLVDATEYMSQLWKLETEASEAGGLSVSARIEKKRYLERTRWKPTERDIRVLRDAINRKAKHDIV